MGCTTSMKTKQLSPRKSEKVIKACVLIQNWYRRYVARLEVRRRCTWSIFQSIEYAGEQDQLKLYNFFNDMLSQMQPGEDGFPKLLKAFTLNQRPSVYDTMLMEEEEQELWKATNPDNITIEPSYKGPHLTFPLNLNQLHRLVQAFRRKLPLHAKYVLQILHETRKLMKQRHNICYASTSISKQITICGDLHGKLTDLYMIFHKNGLPAVDNPYIFNGDFVDRGSFSLEVAVVLFACFLMHPNEVYINRGNHEDHIMNLRYGFVKELNLKYKTHSPQIIKLFEDVFSWLPLATIIDEKILVCHGGISDTTDLRDMARIDRHKFVSTLQPPGMCDDISQLSQKDLWDWKQILDVLWSDPKSKIGCSPNTFRGGGTYFGPDVTETFLKKNGLTLLIRSHECKQEGYEYTHDGKVLTIFSASSYYEYGSNRGAYVQIQGPDHQTHFVQYLSNHSPALRKITFTQRVGMVESSAIQDLKERIIASRTELMREFHKYDKQESGEIHLSDWCFVMETVLEMDLPWRTLQSKLCKKNYDGKILYDTTFEELRIQHRYSGNGPSITEMLYKNKDNLETIFRLMDKDSSGFISMEEFQDAISILVKQLGVKMDESNIPDIARSIDMNKDGFIDFNEFLEAFRIVDTFGKDPVQASPTPLDFDPNDPEQLSISKADIREVEGQSAPSVDRVGQENPLIQEIRDLHSQPSVIGTIMEEKDMDEER